jgi:hypothetical protein
LEAQAEMDTANAGNVARIVGRILVVVAAVFLVISVVGAIVGTRFVYGTVDYVVDSLASRSGFSLFLVKGIVILATIPFFWAVANFTRNVFGLLNMGWSGPLVFYKNKYGIIILAYVSLFFIMMYLASKDAYAYKFCADTPEQIWVSDSSGRDPVYGIEAKPCNRDQVMELRNGNGNLRAPHEIRIADVNAYEWFNGATSKSMVWYDLLPNGDYRFFDRSGHDPNTDQLLLPVTPEVVRQLRQREAMKEAIKKQMQAEQVAQEASAKEIADMQTLAAQAQKEFDSGDYKAAKENCDQVLHRQRQNEPCRTVQPHASVKLAQQLVKESQIQFERGQFDEALWSAENALKLDPTNPHAAKLKQLALQMKPHAQN